MPVGAVPVGAPPQQPQMVIAQPINDIQLIALIAAQVLAMAQGRDGKPSAESAVACAVDLVAHAIVDGNPAAITRRVQELKEQRGLDG